MCKAWALTEGTRRITDPSFTRKKPKIHWNEMCGRREQDFAGCKSEVPFHARMVDLDPGFLWKRSSALRFYSNSAYAEYKIALFTATGAVLAADRPLDFSSDGRRTPPWFYVASFLASPAKRRKCCILPYAALSTTSGFVLVVFQCKWHGPNVLCPCSHRAGHRGNHH